jgi:plasmid stabilization system protein ParE
MSLALVQSEDFLSDLEHQFEWYVHETELDLADAIELAEKFKTAVLDTLEFLLRHPGAGHPRFPQFTDLDGTRSWRVNRPFDRFLIYYHVQGETLFADRLIEGHRGIAGDRGQL